MWASVAVKVVKKDAPFIVTTTNCHFYVDMGYIGVRLFV
jgi:hypothetical protein